MTYQWGPYGPALIQGSQVSGGALDTAGLYNWNNAAGATVPLVNNELVRRSFANSIQYLLPNGESSLFGLSSKFSEETALAIEHGFYTKVMIFPTFTISASLATGASSCTVANSAAAAQAIRGGLYLWVGTINSAGTGMATTDNSFSGEIVQVTSVSGTTINLTRAIGTTVQQNPTPQYSLFVHVGNAYADASTRPDSFLTQEIRVTNYTQIFRNAWAISGSIAAQQNVIGESNIAKSRLECMNYHAMDIEKQIIFGSKGTTASLVAIGTSGYQGRTMQGVIRQITDNQGQNLFLPGDLGTSTGANNITTATSNNSSSVSTPGYLNIDDLENWFNYLVDMSYTPMSGKSRVAFVGKTAHVVLNRLARKEANYWIENGTTEWGLRFAKINLTRGELIMIEHPLLNTNLVWASYVLALDIPAISVAYLIGRKTQAEEYNQKGLAIDSAIDAQGGSLLSELTIMCKNPSGCGLMTNVQTAVSVAGVVY